jgi:hypothetical protein
MNPETVRNWIKLNVKPSTRYENGRVLKHWCELDFMGAPRISHAEFQAAMAESGYEAVERPGHCDGPYYKCAYIGKKR